MSSSLPLRVSDYFFQVSLPIGANHLELLRTKEDKAAELREAEAAAEAQKALEAARKRNRSVSNASGRSMSLRPFFMGQRDTSANDSDHSNDSDTPLNILQPKLRSAHAEVSHSNASRGLLSAFTTHLSPSRSNRDEDVATPAQAKMKRKHPIDYHYDSTVIQRFPDSDYSEQEAFPQNINMFCFPNGLRLRYEPDSPPEATCHSFVAVTTESGQKSYGVCLTIHEKIQEPLSSQLEEIIDDWRADCIATTDLEYLQYIQSQLAVNQEKILKARSNQMPDISPQDLEEIVLDAEEKVQLYKELIRQMDKVMPIDLNDVYVPRCVGIIGRWPFYDFFGDWLKEATRVVKGVYNCENDADGKEDAGTDLFRLNVPLERLLSNLIYEIPLPPPGRVEVKVSIGRHSLFCSRPPVNSIHVLQNFSLYPLFRCLSVAHIISIFEHALTEKRILFLSKHYSMLTLACESIVLLLYPFSWQHHYIPILPAEGIRILQATMPFIIGVNKEYFSKVDELEPDWKSDICIVDLDMNTIESDCNPPQIPPRDRRKLVARLLKYTGAQVVSAPQPVHPGQKPSKQPTVYELPPKGVPLTVRHAYPLGKFVPRTAVSRRWLAQVEADVDVKEDGGSGEESVDPSFDFSRRRSSNNVLSSSLKQETALVNPEQTSPSALVSSPPPLPASVSATHGRGSFDNIRQKFRFNIPMTRPKHQAIVTRSATMNDDDYEEGASSEFEQRSLGGVLKHSGEMDGEAEARKLYESLRTEEDMKSGSSIMRAANSIGTDAGSLYRNNDDSAFATRQPKNYPASVASSVTTAPTTYYDPSIKQSTPSIAESSTLGSQSVSRLQHAHRPTHHSYRRSKTKEKPTLTEGHAFTLISLDVSSSTTSLTSNSTSSRETVAITPVNTQRRPSQPEDSTQLADPPPKSPSINAQVNPPETEPAASKSIRNLAASISSLGTIPRKLNTTKSPTGSESVLSSAAGDSEAQNQSPSKPVASSPQRNTAAPWKGDSNARPEDAKVCRLCLEPLDCGGLETTALQCQYCKSMIHASCIPLIEGSPCITFFNEKKIQYSFFKVFTSLLKSYRNYIVIPEKLRLAKEAEFDRGPGVDGNGHPENRDFANLVGLDLMPDDWFRKQDFLASVDRETRAYLTHIVETQNFVQFTLERVELPESDYEILFFDESIKAKLNRSKLKFSKETTPFLKDGAYSIRATISALPPNTDGLDKNKTYSTSFFPLTVDKTLLVPARKANPLVTEADQNMMRSHTNELVNRTHIAATKRKQDFSKWMRTKWKHFGTQNRPENRFLNGDMETLTEDERDRLFEDKIVEVGTVIGGYESAHLSSQTNAELQAAIEDLHAQQFLLIDMTEAHLVDNDNQEVYKSITNRLLQVLTLYKEHLFALENPEYGHHTSTARASSIRRHLKSEDNSGSVTRSASPAVGDHGSIAPTLSIPAVRSRSESLRKAKGPELASPTSSVRSTRPPSAGSRSPDRRQVLQSPKVQLPESTENADAVVSPADSTVAVKSPCTDAESPSIPSPIRTEHGSTSPTQSHQSVSSHKSSRPTSIRIETSAELQVPNSKVRPRSESISKSSPIHHAHGHHHTHHHKSPSQKSTPTSTTPGKSPSALSMQLASIDASTHSLPSSSMLVYQEPVQTPATPNPQHQLPSSAAGSMSSLLSRKALHRKSSMAASIDSILSRAKSSASGSLYDGNGVGDSGMMVDAAINEISRAEEELRVLVEATRKRIPEMLGEKGEGGQNARAASALSLGAVRDEKASV